MSTTTKTKKQLCDLLSEKGVSFKKSAKKEDLLSLLAKNKEEKQENVGKVNYGGEY